jgi:NhaP-type Na+/H+ or K+/H+ antiporter
MELFLITLLAALLIALIFKGSRRVMLKALGWNDRPLVLEVRFGAILFLVCANGIAAIAYWYPWYLCRYHAAPDDRYGFALATSCKT